MTALPTRQLGRYGPKVTSIGFGTMGLSIFYGQVKPDAERMKVLDAAYDMGELFWDTSDMYGDSEDLLGRWFAANPEKRKNVFLATKFGARGFKDGKPTSVLSAEYVVAACAISMSRLGVDVIDLYYCHRVNPETPIEETMQALAKLKEEGKIRCIGLSEVASSTVRRACKVAHVDAVQIEYSPFTTDIESAQIGLLATCRELGVATVAYSPIGRGMVTGTYRSHDSLPENDLRKRMPRFSAENFPKNLKVVDEIAALAAEKGCSPSQLTLAWLLAQGDDIIPIPGTTRVERLEENLGALKVRLTAEEEASIRKAVDNVGVTGSRYPEPVMHTLFAETKPLE